MTMYKHVRRASTKLLSESLPANCGARSPHLRFVAWAVHEQNGVRPPNLHPARTDGSYCTHACGISGCVCVVDRGRVVQLHPSPYERKSVSAASHGNARLNWGKVRWSKTIDTLEKPGYRLLHLASEPKIWFSVLCWPNGGLKSQEEARRAFPSSLMHCFVYFLLLYCFKTKARVFGLFFLRYYCWPSLFWDESPLQRPETAKSLEWLVRFLAFLLSYKTLYLD